MKVTIKLELVKDNGDSYFWECPVEVHSLDGEWRLCLDDAVIFRGSTPFKVISDFIASHKYIIDGALDREGFLDSGEG